MSDWSRTTNPAAAGSLGAYYSTSRMVDRRARFPSTLIEVGTWGAAFNDYDGVYQNTPRQCPGCGAWKQEARHGRLVCAYCGNPA